MNREELIDRLRSLMKDDYDAIRNYNQAIAELDVPNIRDQLTLFRDDHERHIDNLSAMLRSMSAQPLERPDDIKTSARINAVRSEVCTESILKAMEAGETIIHDAYAQALDTDLPIEVRTQIQTNFEDEQCHLQYFCQALCGRIWEPSESYFS
jgi:rubrerythrin